ncbi:replication-relaxation family protein [Yoonia sp. SDW83-1]|uniref:replication-relaxation family protein n=1 Tax=Yoonia sp. SDW83-1 TaxID=3366945 RepID=UPI00398C7299
MSKVVPLSITPTIVAALSAILAYRYLSVKQVATIVGVAEKSASEMLLRLQRHHLLGSFGNAGMYGSGKTPKVYFLTRTGHRLLSEECEADGAAIKPFSQVKMNTKWTPLMFHRMATLDVMSYVERDCAALSDYRLVGTLVEYRREKTGGGKQRCETTDYVATPLVSENKIVPDAGFAIEHVASGKRALFLIEVDRGTTPLTSNQPEEDVKPFIAKLAQYDRYLASGRVRDRFAHLGSFAGFHLLVITTGGSRVANMRAAAVLLSPAFHHLYRFSTLDAVSHNVLHDGWLSRDHADNTTYKLIKGS